MRPSIRLGRVFGINIGVHYSWLIIAFLIVFSLAGHFHSTNPQWPPLVIWSLAAITALLFFASIVVHELSHAAVAKSRGMSVSSERRPHPCGRAWYGWVISISHSLYST